MSLLRKIEQTLDKRLRSLFGSSNKEAIELYREALDQIAARAIPNKRGERLFPFDLITLELRPQNPEHKTILETLFAPNQLEADIKATLAEERIAPPPTLTISIHYSEQAQNELTVHCEKTQVADRPAPPPAVPHELAVMWLITLAGTSSSPEFLVDRPQVNIGRERDVIDSQGRAVRRNELHFPDGPDNTNSTVSRSHAHIRFDSTTGEWRIYDDGSSLGTAIFRDGNRIDVPAHAPRGALLRPSDEICLGQARLLFAIPR